MLFFVDESWQTIGGRQIGALGAVVIKQNGYNAFCREFFAMKRTILGAQELNECEVRGQHAFAKAAFKRQALHGDSHWIAAAEEVFRLLDRHHAKVMAVWTDNPAFVSLRSAQTTILSSIYKTLVTDFRAFMSEKDARGRLGSINFDQRGLKEDEAVGCAVQNYMVRTGVDWGRYFIQVPNFTVSAVSPGLQAADFIAHLVAHLADPSERPELQPYLDKVERLAYQRKYGKQLRRCITHVR